MVMGHFVHAASFHYGEQISAQLCVGKKKNRDKHNVWLVKKGDRAVWRVAAWTRLSLLSNSLGWDGTAYSS